MYLPFYLPLKQTYDNFEEHARKVSTNLEVREEVVVGLARHVDDVVVLHRLLVHLPGLAHHHRDVAAAE